MADVTAFERWWLNAWPHRLWIRQFIPAFLKACPEPFRGEVLEVGAGSGWTSRQILATFPQVELTATDRDETVMASLQRLGSVFGQRLHFKQADVLALPFDRHSFDIVIAVHVMGHVSDVPQAIRQMLRVLRPGGLIGLADEDRRLAIGPLGWLFSAASRLVREDLERLLREEGCEGLRAEGGRHFFLWARKPYPITPDDAHA